MYTNFFNQLLSKQQQKEIVPSNEVIAEWALNLIGLLFPELSISSYSSTKEIEN
jgi:serine O-acetyltransferase